MAYTTEQKDLIEGLLHAHFLGRKLSPELHVSFMAAYDHLKADTLSRADLCRIRSALEFMMPEGCQTCNIEGYRDITEALLATQLMLNQAPVL